MRAAAADVLVQIGKAVIPVVHPKLDSPDPQLRKMAAVILGRINRREFGSLVNSHITGNLIAIYCNFNHLEALAIYAKHPSISVLQSALQEQNEQLVEEIFYLLTAVYDPNVIKTVTDSLESDSSRVRANAVEALETFAAEAADRRSAVIRQPPMEALAQELGISLIYALEGGYNLAALSTGVRSALAAHEAEERPAPVAGETPLYQELLAHAKRVFGSYWKI